MEDSSGVLVQGGRRRRGEDDHPRRICIVAGRFVFELHWCSVDLAGCSLHFNPRQTVDTLGRAHTEAAPHFFTVKLMIDDSGAVGR